MRERTQTWPSHHAGIAAAIDCLASNYEDQPSLDDMASVAGMSAHHFQRTFKTWTGVRPRPRHQGLLITSKASSMDSV